MGSFKTVHDFNWAWQFWEEEREDWVQFCCTECLKLEFSYQAYLLNRHEDFKCADILQGTVDFDKLILTID